MIRKIVITACVCFIFGIIAGVGGYWYYQKKSSDKIASAITTSTIKGPEGNIIISDIHNKPDYIEMNIKAKEKGEIKTMIRKSSFCSPVYKNSFSFILYGGLQNLQPVISYGVEYRRQLITRIHVLAGLKINSTPLPVYQFNGFEVFLGAGANF